MAYLAFQDLGGAWAAGHMLAPAPRHDPLIAKAEELSALEWAVVAIARRDRRASLRAPSRLATALRVLLRQPNPRLADARLEALRRLAVLLWRDGGVASPDERRRFAAAGFTSGQFDALIAGIRIAPDGGDSVRRRPAPQPASANPKY